MSAATQYAERVDAVLEQRTRLRGPQPPGDLFAHLPSGNSVFAVNPHGALSPNMQAVHAFAKPGDVVLDVGGGAGRYSLPLGLSGASIVNVEQSRAMAAAFQKNAAAAGIDNVRVIDGDWLSADAPQADLVLVNHVLYLTREIDRFIAKLDDAARRRVLITLYEPPGPSWQRLLFERVYREPEVPVPGIAELTQVIWEMGLLPDIHVLPMRFPPAASNDREAAINAAITAFGNHQWALWPMVESLTERVRVVLTEDFDSLFAETDRGFVPRWIAPAREVMITWSKE